jgi:3-carboxy-cis,cis-muconate cycloisomerase
LYLAGSVAAVPSFLRFVLASALSDAEDDRNSRGQRLDATIHDFERATGPWHAEWIAIPESFVLTAGSLHQAKFALGGLIVDEKQMAKKP